MTNLNHNQAYYYKYKILFFVTTYLKIKNKNGKNVIKFKKTYLKSNSKNT